MKVKTTGEFIRLGVTLAETGKFEEEGKILEVSEERFNVLNGNNPFKAIFVIPVEEKKTKVVETAKKEDKKETAVKKTRKKTK